MDDLVQTNAFPKPLKRFRLVMRIYHQPDVTSDMQGGGEIRADILAYLSFGDVNLAVPM